MKRILFAALLALTLTASAQQSPQPPQPNAAQQDIEKQAQAVQLRIKLNTQILSGLVEFQQLQDDTRMLQQLGQQYQAAAVAKPETPAKPAAEVTPPIKPTPTPPVAPAKK